MYPLNPHRHVSFPAAMARSVFAVLLLAFLSLTGTPTGASEVRPGQSFGARNSETPAWFKQSFLEFEDDVAEATRAGRRVMLYFHQEGCPYCARLVEENFSDPQIRDFMIEHFDGITVNIWGDREVVSVGGHQFSEKTFAAALKVQYTPTLIFLDETGKVALRLDGYYPLRQFRTALDYVAEKQEQKLSFSQYQTANRGNTSGKLIEEDFYSRESDLKNLLAKSDKPLAVYFEATDCDQCTILHQNILNDIATLSLITKMNNVQLAINSDRVITTPAGKKVTARQWASDLDIGYTPSVIFFDSAANEVMRISAFVKTLHFQSVYAYVLEKAYLEEPNFQRYISARAEKIREAGNDTDIWGYQSSQQ